MDYESACDMSCVPPWWCPQLWQPNLASLGGNSFHDIHIHTCVSLRTQYPLLQLNHQLFILTARIYGKVNWPSMIQPYHLAMTWFQCCFPDKQVLSIWSNISPNSMKFRAVFGTELPWIPKTIRPAGWPPILTSRNALSVMLWPARTL
jgi:hypothetical protein